MAEMTYDEALESIIENTEIGYTIASQDRLWIVFTFDLWSTDQFRYNRLYPTGDNGGWAYDLTNFGVKVWTTRAEADAFAASLRERMAKSAEAGEVYVMNLGDSARYEALVIGRDNGRPTRTTPRFSGSQAAWEAMIEMSKRWLAENT